MNSSSDSTYTLDQALQRVGNCSKYQYRVFFTIALQFIGQGMLLISPTYLFITPTLLCTNGSGQQVTCLETSQNCDYYTVTFQSGYPRQNIVTDFDLICSRKKYIAIASSSMFFGSILGCLFFSYIGVILVIYNLYKDHKGRRNTLLISWGITTFGMVGQTLSFDLVWFVILNIIAGFGVNGAFNVAFVIINEVSSESFRQKASIFLLVIFALAEIMCAGIYYAFENWRTAYAIFGLIPAVTGFILCFTIYETPKFYMTKDSTINAINALNKIASANRKPLLDLDTKLLLVLPSERIDDSDSQQSIKGGSFIKDTKEKVQYGYFDLFSFKSLRGNTIGFIGMLFALQLIYYGGQYGLNQMSNGNAIFEIGACIGVAELSSYILIEFTIEKIPRRLGIIFSQACSIILCACFLFYGVTDTAIDIPDDCDLCEKMIITIVLSCLIRIFVSFSFAIQPLFANEVYPTVIRTIGTGFVFSMGLFGSFLAPYTFDLADYWNINPYFLIGGLALIGPIATILVRETKGAQLEDEILEVVKQQ